MQPSVELAGAIVLNGSGHLPSFEVERTRQQLAAQPLAVGQRVRITAPSLRAFPDDGA